jgi:hypothetical protein
MEDTTMSSQLSLRLRDPRPVATGLRASGVIGAIGLGFLVAMFAAFAAGARSTGMALGWINDVTGVVTLPLALPGVLALHAHTRPSAGRAGDVLLVLGIGSGGAIVALQLLLVTGVLTFEEQIGPVMIAYLGLGTWFVVGGRIAERAGIVRAGTLNGVLAATYAGYPVWAFRLARALEAEPVMLGEPATA